MNPEHARTTEVLKHLLITALGSVKCIFSMREREAGRKRRKEGMKCFKLEGPQRKHFRDLPLLHIIKILTVSHI